MSSKRRALISVTDKTGIETFSRRLLDLGFELISTGGTATLLREAGLAVRDVSEITGFAECLDGRVKTLHPSIHAGLLADRRLESHEEALAELQIVPIDVVAVNLYPFEATVSKPHEFEEAVEAIDIGGPSMIRSAAKNHASVWVLVDPADYMSVLEALTLDANGEEHRRKLAAKAFRHTAYYDSLIARYMTAASGEMPFTETLTVGLRQSLSFRYGENPHQAGALYRDALQSTGVSVHTQHWGKELSYNNLGDADGAWELVADMPPGSCAIIKHGNPCGAALGATLAESYAWAREADSISAFGGIAAFHGVVDLAAAEAMTAKGNFLEVVLGTGFSDEALQVFRNRSGWGQEVRLLSAVLPTSEPRLSLRAIGGGAIVQEADEDPGAQWRIVTERVPSEEEMAALRLMWTIVQHVHSNAIVVGDSRRLHGVGTGQMNRVQSVRLALEQAGDAAPHCVLASDAFFPFPDSIEALAQAGIRAVVQPGGSKKDADVVEAANRLGVAMCFTGVRHFRH